MTTPYGITTSIGSQGYSGYVNTPINGPLSTNNYPFSMAYHSYGTLTGKNPTPPQFFPSQEPVYSDMSVNARAQYLRATALSYKTKAQQDALGKLSTPVVFTSWSSQRQFPVSSHVNYIAPIPSSMLTDIRKSVAVGKSGFKESNDVLDMGNSGTSARLLMGLVSASDISSTFTGDESLRKRPMNFLIILKFFQKIIFHISKHLKRTQ
jgi:hypothetical protein